MRTLAAMLLLVPLFGVATGCDDDDFDFGFDFYDSPGYAVYDEPYYVVDDYYCCDTVYAYDWGIFPW